MYQRVETYGLGGFIPTEPNGNLISYDFVRIEDCRPPVEHRSADGLVLVPVELYCSYSNHSTFRLVGDEDSAVYVTCPLAQNRWEKCATHTINANVATSTPAELDAAATVEVLQVIQLVQSMEANGCVHHRQVEAPANDVDDAILSRITTEFISGVIAQYS